MELVTPPFLQCAVQIPIYLVWLVGIVLALANWQRHPAVSMLAVVALALFFLQALTGSFLNLWLPLTLRERGFAVSQIGTLLAVGGVIQVLVGAIAWGLIVAAVFGWRGEPAKTAQSAD